jgi:putative hemolysin
VITIIVGELVPKVFALRNKEWVCLTLSPLMQWFALSVFPAVWLLESAASGIVKLSELSWSPSEGGEASEGTLHELRGAAALARMSRFIGHREEGIILSASRLSATPLRKIMVPSEFIGMLHADQSLAEALVTAHMEMHTRLPVTEELGNPQRIIGYANFKDIVSALRIAPNAPSIRGLVRYLHSFKADVSVADCLEYLIRERSHIALAREVNGQVVGMITLEDILEELVGEIHDEFDRIPAHLTPAGMGWIAGGFVTLDHLRETAGIDLQPSSEKPLYTLHDWIAERLSRPPRGGDEIQTNTCRVLVRKVRHVLVQEAYLEKTSGSTTPTDAFEQATN